MFTRALHRRAEICPTYTPPAAVHYKLIPYVVPGKLVQLRRPSSSPWNLSTSVSQKLFQSFSPLRRYGQQSQRIYPDGAARGVRATIDETLPFPETEQLMSLETRHAANNGVEATTGSSGFVKLRLLTQPGSLSPFPLTRKRDDGKSGATRGLIRGKSDPAFRTGSFPCRLLAVTSHAILFGRFQIFKQQKRAGLVFPTKT